MREIRRLTECAIIVRDEMAFEKLQNYMHSCNIVWRGTENMPRKMKLPFKSIESNERKTIIFFPNEDTMDYLPNMDLHAIERTGRIAVDLNGYGLPSFRSNHPSASEANERILIGHLNQIINRDEIKGRFQVKRREFDSISRTNPWSVDNWLQPELMEHLRKDMEKQMSHQLSYPNSHGDIIDAMATQFKGIVPKDEIKETTENIIRLEDSNEEVKIKRNKMKSNVVKFDDFETVLIGSNNNP